MKKQSKSVEQLLFVSNFEELASTPFKDTKNAICWNRNLKGDYSEIVNKVEMKENIVVLSQENLRELDLSKQGCIARETLLQDWQLLEKQGAAPILNLIKNYERDESFPFFPTDVYSFHVDRSPIPTATFLCTYYGEASEIVPNNQAKQKILIPEIREELQQLFKGSTSDFDSFLKAYFFDLHYQANANAPIINLGLGNLWKLAVDHPKSKVSPCIHRAPLEKKGEKRLLMIC